MSREPRPVFVEKRTYRGRRLVDAARLLPVLGVALISIPLLWVSSGAISTTHAMIYLFGIWVLLVAGSGLISRLLKGTEEAEEDGDVGLDGAHR